VGTVEAQTHLTASMRQAWACIWAYTATRTLNPTWKNSSPIIMQSPTAVTHCAVAAPQFTYPRRDGRPSHSVCTWDRSRALHSMVSALGGCSTGWASKTRQCAKDNKRIQFIMQQPGSKDTWTVNCFLMMAIVINELLRMLTCDWTESYRPMQQLRPNCQV
jgi:hypothetical protein